MNRISGNLNADEKALKEILSAEDILTFPFRADGGIEFTVVYADAITDKELLGEQVVRPLLHYAGKPQTEEVKKRLTSPELKTETDFNKLAQEVLTGNPVLLWEGMNEAIVT